MKMDAYVSPNLTMTAYGLRTVGIKKFDSRDSEKFDGKDSFCSLFGIFNGHNGDEASFYAKANLKKHIIAQEEFWNDDDASITSAIKKGFVSCQDAMWHQSLQWPRPSSDSPSLSGTSASVVIFTRGKIFIGHVGDSKVVLGYQDPNSQHWIGQAMTTIHRPGDPKERAMIEAAGGKVSWKGGLANVVLRKPRPEDMGYETRSGLNQYEEVPFLPISRSLGDFWGYNFQRQVHMVSPTPDVTVVEINKNFRCIILGNHGLWKLVSPQNAVHVVATDLGRNGVPD
ncbi:unnamed protein product [Orchesella dallaii]